MKGNYFNYLKEYKDKSFSEYPFSEADALVLCQLSYLDFFKFITAPNYLDSSMMIRDIHALDDISALFPDIRYKKENSKLFEAVSTSKRYESLRVVMPFSFTDEENEFQFCAVTFVADNILPFVTFRGTDKTIVGWKEDMNLSFMCPTPGQELAAKYVLLASERLDTAFNIGGHSKGGNFAVYGAMCANEQVRDNINLIFSLDGPGFRPETLESLDFAGIANKVVKILPKSSLIGMLLEKENTFEIIEAKNVGFNQHLLANWIIKNGAFIRTELGNASAVLDKSINNWVYSTPPEDLEKFWNDLFEIIYASDADNVVDFEKHLKTSLQGMFNAVKEMPQETQDKTYSIIRSYFEINKETLLPKIEFPKFDQLKENITEFELKLDSKKRGKTGHSHSNK